MTWVGVIYYGKCNYYVLIDCIWHCVRGKFIQNYFDFSNFLLIWCKNLESHIGWPNSHIGWQNSSESFLLFLFQSIILPYTNYFYHIVRCFLIMSFISIHSIFVVLFFFFLIFLLIHCFCYITIWLFFKFLLSSFVFNGHNTVNNRGDFLEWCDNLRVASYELEIFYASYELLFASWK